MKPDPRDPDPDREVLVLLAVLAAALLAIAVAMAVVPVRADDGPPSAAQQAAAELEFTPSTEPGTVGVLRYHNRTTYWGRPQAPLEEFTVTIPTPAGPLVVFRSVTVNNQCGPEEACPDTLEVLEAPPGTVAVPPSVTLNEGDTVDIRIIPFAGV
jgi:hypothetical protein